MARAISIGFIVITLFLVVLSAKAKEPALTFSENQDAVVFIQVTSTRSDNSTATETGSGFIVSDSGYIITNNHLFDVVHSGDVALSVSGATGSRFRPGEQLDVIERNPQVDLALLRFKDASRKRQHVTLGETEKITPGTPLYMIGFPEGLDVSIASGSLSSLSGTGGTWQTTLPANRGNSGGPVFNGDGQVVAVVRADLGRGINGISFVIPINLSRPLLLSVPGLPSPTAAPVLVLAPAGLIVEGSGPNFLVPRISGRTLDACIKSPQFPEFVRMQCTAPAQNQIAEAFCRLAGYRLAASYKTEWTPTLKSSLKYTEEISLTNSMSSRWVQDNTGGDIFTQIVCMN